MQKSTSGCTINSKIIFILISYLLALLYNKQDSSYSDVQGPEFFYLVIDYSLQAIHLQSKIKVQDQEYLIPSQFFYKCFSNINLMH